jgi:hypothetical protein
VQCGVSLCYGDTFDVLLRSRWRSLIVCIGRLTALVGMLAGLAVAIVALGRGRLVVSRRWDRAAR